MQSSTFQPTGVRSGHVRCLSVLFVVLFSLAILVLLCPLPGYTPVVVQRAWAASIVSVSQQQAQSAQGFQAATVSTTTSPTPTATASQTPTMSTTRSVSARLVRISQLDPGQYRSSQEYNTWAYSACSTASMTEVLNAWWGTDRYRITDVLQQEIAANAITSKLGLLDNDGIARTMRRFGFDVSLPSLTLDQVISTANAGEPVIAGWPPSKYAGGHLVVVIGGDATSVRLADSSSYNRKTVSRTQFLAWWGGFAAVAKPDPYSIYDVGQPQLTATFINRVLDAYGSPMKGMGQAILTTLNQYSLDGAMALGFYLHESRMGTEGEARETKAWANTRCVPDYACVDQDRGGYAAFDTGIAGLKEWCWQITNTLYAAGGRVLVDDIIPRFAPTADNNDVAAYVASLKHSADVWRAGGLTP